MRALRKQGPETNREGFYGEVSDKIDQPPSSVNNWVYGRCAPNAESLIELFKYFDPAFANEWLALAGLYCVRIEDRDAVAAAEGAAALDDAPEALRRTADAIEKLRGGGKARVAK